MVLNISYDVASCDSFNVYPPRFKLITSGCFNILRPRPNGRHFADDTFKRIFFLIKNVRI